MFFSKVELELYVVVQLCQRNSGKMDKTSREVGPTVGCHCFSCLCVSAANLCVLEGCGGDALVVMLVCEWSKVLS